MDDPASSRPPAEGPVTDSASGPTAVAARVTALVGRLMDEIPGLRRLLTEIARVEFIDRSLVIAAQALFSVTPLIVAVAAFSPSDVVDRFLEQIGAMLGMGSSDAHSMTEAANINRVQTQTGVIGILIVLISALSFARAMQRLYLRVWDLPNQRGIANIRRTVAWLLGWLFTLILLAATVGLVDSLSFEIAGEVFRLIAGVGLWWWTAHALLGGRVPWRALWVSAVITAVGLAVLIDLSRVFMPAYAKANTDQFGGIGLMFAASTWLLIVGGVITGGAMVGRIIVEEPTFRPGLDWIERTVWRRGRRATQ
jgi:membrane protein